MKKTLGSAGLLALSASSAHAQAFGTVGDALSQVLYGNLVQVLGYGIIPLVALGGIFLFVKGLLQLAKSSSNQHPVGNAIAAMLAGVFMIAATEIAGVGMFSLFGSSLFTSSDNLAIRSLDTPQVRTGYLATVVPAQPKVCLGDAAPATCMAENIATNMVPIGVLAVIFTAFITGFVLLASRLKHMAALGAERGGSVGPGQIAIGLGIAALLMNSSGLLSIVTTTFMGQGGSVGINGVTNASSALLSYSSGLGSNFAQFEKMISSIFIILVFFGVWAFVKGLFILKKVSEGDQRDASVSHALTFMAAGVLLANAKVTTCTVMMTVAGAPGILGNVCGY